MKRVMQNMEEQIFGSSQEDMFAIYQLKDDALDISFMGTKMLERAGRKVDKDNYELVYTSPLYPELTLDMIYGIFNSDSERPADFYGHSLSSDIILMRRNQLTEAWFVEPFGFKNVTLSFWQPYMYAVAVADRFVSLVDSQEGFDYSIYDGKDFSLIDGGIYDDVEADISEAFTEILSDMIRDEKRHPLVCEYSSVQQVNFDLIDDFASEAEQIRRGEMQPLTTEELFKRRTELFFHPIDGRDSCFIEDNAWAYILSKKDIEGLDIKIKNLAIYGSRCRGLENPESDIDIVFEYEGDYSEDYLFNYYNSDGFSISGIKMDFNPIKAEKTGTLNDYLTRVENYLSKKRLFLDLQRAFPLSDIVSKLKEMGYESKVEYIKKRNESYRGITIFKKNESSVSPIIRYEYILENSHEIVWTLDKLAEACIEYYKNNIPKTDIQEMVMNRDYVLSNTKICFQMKSNMDIVKRTLDDMDGIEAYLKTYIDLGDGDKGSMKVKDIHLKLLEISYEEIWSAAKRNTFSDTYISSIPVVTPIPMYIVTNRRAHEGASCILDRESIKAFSRSMGYSGKYLVIPSSIHETLIIPTEVIEEEGLFINDSMISDVNETCVNPNEWLGKHTFFIDVNEKYGLK